MKKLVSVAGIILFLTGAASAQGKIRQDTTCCKRSATSTACCKKDEVKRSACCKQPGKTSVLRTTARKPVKQAQPTAAAKPSEK